jgi:hypothetical protein
MWRIKKDRSLLTALVFSAGFPNKWGSHSQRFYRVDFLNDNQRTIIGEIWEAIGRLCGNMGCNW